VDHRTGQLGHRAHEPPLGVVGELVRRREGLALVDVELQKRWVGRVRRVAV
jgi:hypothetical protein